MLQHSLDCESLDAQRPQQRGVTEFLRWVPLSCADFDCMHADRLLPTTHDWTASSSFHVATPLRMACKEHTDLDEQHLTDLLGECSHCGPGSDVGASDSRASFSVH